MARVRTVVIAALLVSPSVAAAGAFLLTVGDDAQLFSGTRPLPAPIVPVAAVASCEADDPAACLAYWGVTDLDFAATAENMADDEITRELVAAVVARALATSGGPLPEGPDAFVDDDGSAFEEHINHLAAVSVIRGVGSGTYAPDEPVTRAETAAILVRAFEWLSGEALPSPAEDLFSDDDLSAFHKHVNVAGSLGIVSGDADGLFRPGDPMAQGDLLVAVDRWLDLAVEQDLTAVPESPRSLQLP